MPTGDNSQKGVKTVQTMLAAKKTGNTSKENPPKSIFIKLKNFHTR
jgi:hypothetical protein